MAAVDQRCGRVIRQALALAGADGRVALVAHGHILRSLAGCWLGLGPAGGAQHQQGAATVSVLGQEREQRALLRWNAPGPTGVHSAVTTDGTHYACEPGVRFTVPGRVVVDCAAGLHAGTFHLVVPDNGTPAEFLERRTRGEPQPGGNGYHATSTDGLSFTRAVDLPLPSTRDRWWGNLLSDGSQLLFFGTGPGPWPVASANGMQWAPAPAPLCMPGIDPCVARLRDGSWLVVATKVPVPAQPAAPAQPAPGSQPSGAISK